MQKSIFIRYKLRLANICIAKLPDIHYLFVTMWQSLVQSSSSCCFIVVSRTIIIVVEPWHIVCNERIFLRGIERHDSFLFMSKKIQHTWWEEAAGDDHRQCLAHAGWQAAKDVITIFSVDGGSNYICLQWQLSACRRVCGAFDNLKIAQNLWKGWVIVTKLLVRAENIFPCLKEKGVSPCDPMHGLKRLWNIASVCGIARAITVGHFWSSWFLNQFRMGLVNR